MAISPPPAGSANGSPYAGGAPPASGDLLWKPSPRWAEVRGNDKLEGKQDN